MQADKMPPNADAFVTKAVKLVSPRPRLVPAPVLLEVVLGERCGVLFCCVGSGP